MPLPFGGAFLPLIGSIADRIFGNQDAEKDRAAQREFAQNSIQWKMADAKKAGVNPLAALGAPFAQFTPVGGSSNFGAAGQDVSRALDANRSAAERTSSTALKLQQLSVERAELENQYILSQIAVNKAQLAPPVPAPDVVPGVPGLPGQNTVPVPGNDTHANAVSGVSPATPTQPIFLAGAKVPPLPGWSSFNDVWMNRGPLVAAPYAIGLGAATAGDAWNKFIAPYRDKVVPQEEWIARYLLQKMFGFKR